MKYSITVGGKIKTFSAAGDNFQCFAPKTSQTIEVFGNNSKILPPKSKSQN